MVHETIQSCMWVCASTSRQHMTTIENVMMLTIMTTDKHKGREKKRSRWKSCLLYWNLHHQQTIIWSVHHCSEYNTCVCLSCTCEQKFNQCHQEDTSSGARHARDNRHVSHTHRIWRKHNSYIWQWRHKVYCMCQWWVSCRGCAKNKWTMRKAWNH